MSKVFWPRDLLPRQLPRTRVLSFGYNADTSQNTSIAGIRDIARTLLSWLIGDRDECEGRPIVFVAHCIGGIIVEKVREETGISRDHTARKLTDFACFLNRSVGDSYCGKREILQLDCVGNYFYCEFY